MPATEEKSGAMIFFHGWLKTNRKNVKHVFVTLESGQVCVLKPLRLISRSGIKLALLKQRLMATYELRKLPFNISNDKGRHYRYREKERERENLTGREKG